ncbi:putative nuclease HARBI1 [Hyperolius riggenbachi]|uniref:putative nuclease HARBI1 n=1 Tax=Hyperolius riggenbachi TaxID=752182 RepID=UPI0035A29046
MPTSRAEWDDLKRKFYRMGGIPNVMGAIDCTHVAFNAPKRKEHIYRNRKSYHSINVQVVVDADMVIRNVVTGFPGCCHDAHILKHSGIYDAFESGELSGGWLLGDSGYPCLKWLLTPVGRASTAAEMAYNSAHSRTRVVVERTFGVLKGRFRAISLSGGHLRYSPGKVCKIVMACCVLHNMARKAGLELNEEIPEDDDMPIDDVEAERGGNAARTQVINHFFA